jgi:hypothetical protein
MKRVNFSLNELFYTLSFLLYLAGSSLAQIYNGIELSLWLMAFAMVMTFLTTILPFFGFQWLKLKPQGCRFGRGLAIVIQILSWGTYGTAMFFRLTRELPKFHTLIAFTTVLWATWLLIFIYSRHACQAKEPGATLNQDTPPIQTDEKEHMA